MSNSFKVFGKIFSIITGFLVEFQCILIEYSFDQANGKIEHFQIIRLSTNMNCKH